MTTQLETDLRAALHDRAARIHASPDLLAADYRPRARRIRPRVAIGGGLATAAGTLAAVLSFAGGASSAFAGWTPKPTPPTAAQVAAAQAYCTQNEGFPGMPLKLIDARGPFTIAVYSDGSSNDFCTDGPSFQNVSSWSVSPPLKLAPGKLFMWIDHIADSDGQPYGVMIAAAASDVSAANVTLDDGAQVTATVSNGFAVAWWPGAYHPASAQLTTPAGTVTQTFPRYPCDVHNCDGGGAHGGAPGGGPGGG